MPGFFQAHVRVGAELLVYARKLSWVDVTGYVPEAGSRTALAQDAKEDMQEQQLAVSFLIPFWS
jgi:hypothetical protein